MNRYEMVNIIDVNWGEGDPARAREMIAEEIARSGGELEDSGSMGRRKLAYPVKRQTEGLYLISRFRGAPEGLVPLRDSLKLNSAVLRTLLVRYRGSGAALPGTEVDLETETAATPEAESGESPAGEREPREESAGDEAEPLRDNREERTPE